MSKRKHTDAVDILTAQELASDARRTDARIAAIRGSIRPEHLPGEEIERPVTASVAAEFLALHPKTVVRMARARELPAHPIGQGRRLHWLFYLSELDAWLKSRVISNCHPCRELNGDLQ